jgi:quercetin dioxygenase-like cupin family protein
MTTTAEQYDASGSVALGAAAEVLHLGRADLHLLLDASDTGGAISAHRCRLEDGTVGASPHQHSTASELFYVLSGTAEVLSGNRLIRATEGDLVVVGPNTAHAFAAAPCCDAELLVIVTPGIERFEFFRNLARVRAGELDPEAFAASQAAYDTYPADTSLWNSRQPATGS